MAGSLNQVSLIGNLGADPEVRRLGNGDPVINLRVATSEHWKDKTTGERKEHTDWHQVVCFNPNLCSVIEQYVKKGSKVFVQGKLQTRKWQDQQGNDRYTTEVVMDRFGGQLVLLDRREGGGGTDRDSQYQHQMEERYGKGGSPNDSGHGRSAPMQRQGNVQSGGQSRQDRLADLDDDIPF